MSESVSRDEHWSSSWAMTIRVWTQEAMKDADPGHGMDHIQRVVANAEHIAGEEKASLDVVMPAVWLHDCVIVPKNSPLRSQASRMAAERASQFLHTIGYPAKLIPKIEHCIAAHSFSAGISCESLEARVVQDSDRLEAIGAIGIARCLMTGGALGQQLYDLEEPFPMMRVPQDSVQSIDHFFAKLLKIQPTMQTDAGKRLAEKRTLFLVRFLEELAEEIGMAKSDVALAIRRALPVGA
jgi:uncharacterized protein